MTSYNVFPTTPGNSSFFAPIGNEDITIMKLNDNIEIQWATYFGGTASDEALSVSVEPTGAQVFVVGTSHSTDFPASSTFTNSYQSNNLGSAFILELNNNGQTLWATKFELSGEGNVGFRDCQYIAGSIYVVGDRENLSPPLPNDGQSYYSTDGVGYIGVFKAGGIYIHGTGFGGPLVSNSHTKIFAIDYNGVDAIAITGSTTDPNLPIQNAPAGYGSYVSNNPNLSNAFIAKIGLGGSLDFSYYISSLASTIPGANNLSAPNTYYDVTGDRGNDIKFTPNGNSIYVVGELYGDSFTHHTSPNPFGYNQPIRSVTNLNFGQISSAGFIFKVRNNGAIKSANYFSPSAQDFQYATSMRLQELDFDANDNLYITGHQGITACTSFELGIEYNMPIPNTQPSGFYQKNKTTSSSLIGAYKINSNSFIIAFSSSDEHLWSTYVSGYKKSATTAEKDNIKLPYWEFDPIPGNNLDWYNPDGAFNTSEFAGRFDVNGVNNAGPVLGLDNTNNFKFDVYPNPNQTNMLYIKGNALNSVKIFGLDGKLVLSLNQNNISSINISHLAKGVYVIKGASHSKI